MKKKLLSFILVLSVLITFSCNMIVFGEVADEPTIRVSQAKGAHGDSVVITVSLENNPGIISAKLLVGYDSSKYTLVNAVDSHLLNDGLFCNDLSANPFTLYWNDALALTNNKSNGIIATLTFKIADNCPFGDSDITLTYNPEEIYDQDVHNVHFNAVNGGISCICNHQSGDWEVVTQPTCTTAGQRVKKCLICHEILETEAIPAAGHTWSDWTVKTSPTCETAGVEHRICSVCHSEETRAASATGHKAGAWETTVKPTCTKAGTRVQKCSVCGKVLATETVPATGHKYGDWVVKVAPAFNTDGLKEKVCSVCGDIVTERIPKLSESHVHDFTGKEEIVKQPSCTEEGSKKVYCTEPECGQYKLVTIPALGHTAGEWEIIKQPTCTETGTKVQKCKVCGTVVATETIKATGHGFGDWKVKTPATCKADGAAYRKCSVCGAEETKVIPALGHTAGEWEITKQPTCTETGIRVKKCTVCGEVIATETTPAAGHKYGDWKVKTEATCKADGTAYRKCSVCGLEETKPISALGHTAGEWEVTKQPTCTETGTRVKKCTICGEILSSESISAKGHSYGNWVVKVEPTFKTDGSKEKACSVCGDIVTERIPKLSESHVHDFTGKEEVVKQPTCTEEGSKKMYCTEPECGEYKTVEIPALGHITGEWEVTKVATCTAEGTKVQKCTRCGEVLKTEVIPAAGHKYGGWVIVKEPTLDSEGEMKATCSVCGDVITKVIPKLKKTITANTEGNAEVTVEGVGNTVFDGDVNLVVNNLTSGLSSQDAQNINNHISTVVENKELAVLLNISLQKDSKPIQPNGKVKVSIKMTEEMKALKDIKIVYIADDGTVTLIPFAVNGNTIEFEVDHFSKYGIIAEKKITTSSSSTATVNATTTSSDKPVSTGDTFPVVPVAVTVLLSLTGIITLNNKRRA